MLSLSLLFWLTLVAALISFWWRSDLIKNMALRIVLEHCELMGVQLLDQTMVIRGLWPVRDGQGLLRLRRRYSFEFTSTGEQRYNGMITMLGRRLGNVELDAHIIP